MPCMASRLPVGQHFASTAPHRAKAATGAFSPLVQLTTRQGACLVATNSAYTLGAGVPVREQKQLGKHLMAEPQRPKSSDSLSDVSDGVAEPIEEELFAQAAYLINYFAHRRGFQFLREVSPVAACCSRNGHGPLESCMHCYGELPCIPCLFNMTGSGLEALPCPVERCAFSYLHYTHQPRLVPFPAACRSSGSAPSTLCRSCMMPCAFCWRLGSWPRTACSPCLLGWVIVRPPAQLLGGLSGTSASDVHLGG